MNEEPNHAVGSIIVKDEHRSDGGNVFETQGQRGPVLNHSAVMMTGHELPGGSKEVSEVGENETASMEDPLFMDSRRMLLFAH